MKAIGIVIVGALPLLGLSALAGEPEAEEKIVLQEGRIDLSTTFTMPTGTKGYARTCEHLPDGTFSAHVVSDPVLAEEWRIDEGQPTYEWSGIDGTPKGKDNAQYSVRVGAFGTHYTVTATATWKLVCKDGRKSETRASASMTLDAIRYEFGTEAPGVDGRGENELVDSRPGWLDVNADGCTNTKLLTLLPVSSPLPPEGVSPQNEVGSTEMTFISRGNPLRWRIPCPYWYGGLPTNKPPACCYSNVAKYSISLNPDGCGLHTNVVSVHLPLSDLDSFMEPTCKSASVKAEILPPMVEGSVTNYRVLCTFSDFEPRGQIVCGATSQYREKIRTEENVHRMQFERTEGYGFEDMFSLGDVCQRLNLKPENDVVIQGKSVEEIEVELSLYRMAINGEMQRSWQYWIANRNYREFSAKQKVKIKEAYTYHCCYGRFDENSEKPIVKTPKE